MRCPVFLCVALVALDVLVEADLPRGRQLKRPVQTESVKRKVNHPLRTVQHGRKKTIWSYNPGHRSLAFLVAGDVVEVSPPPLHPGTGVEYRCLGCCGDPASITGKVTASPDISNSVDQIFPQPEGIRVLGTEPNAINDRCLGCCQESVTPSLRVTPRTREDNTTRTNPRDTPPILGRQWPRQTQRKASSDTPCKPPRCNPKRRVVSSSSSEEVSVTRRLRPPSRTGPLCRHYGCHSALGYNADSSSSSEED